MLERFSFDARVITPLPYYGAIGTLEGPNSDGTCHMLQSVLATNGNKTATFLTCSSFIRRLCYPVRMKTCNLGKSGAAITGVSIWVSGWFLIWSTDNLSQASHALMLVLTCALASLVWRPLPVIAGSALSVGAFDWMLIVPRGHFAVDLREDAILLLTMLSVTTIIALLLGQLKDIAAKAVATAQRAEQLRIIAEALGEESDDDSMIDLVRSQFTQLFGAKCFVQFSHGLDTICTGSPSVNQQAALALCARERRELGLGTDCYADFPGWVAPLGKGEHNYGAVLVEQPERELQSALQDHARALLTLFVTSVERRQARDAALHARAEQQLQQARNALLASIAHDHRTPLATILGAASSLVEQHNLLDDKQRSQLARTIVLETERLSRLTDNAMRLAKLDSPHLAINEDWQCAEELVGTVVQRAGRRHPKAQFHVLVEPGLPLFRADGVLMDQLLDNLVDNAVRHAGLSAPIEICARAIERRVVFDVADRGPGVDPRLLEQGFDLLTRGTQLGASVRGVGLGLAICRAIARVHQGGRIECMRRPGGGALFRASLPLPHEQMAALLEVGQ